MGDEPFRWTGIEIAAVIWGCVIAIAMTVSYFKGRNALRNKQRPLSQDTQSIELEKVCPTCNTHLRGRPLEATDYERNPPLVVWTACPNCGFAERAVARQPWTKIHGDQIRSAERTQTERALVLQYEDEIRSYEVKKRQRLMSHVEGLLQCSPAEFEYAVAEILKANGYTDVSVCGGSGDLSVDIECVSPEGRKTAVQCKRYAGDKPVGSKEVQTFIGMLHRHHKIKSGLYVTTSRFTKPAQELAQKQKIKLIDDAALGAMAAAMKPSDDVDEGEEIARLRTAIEALPTWSVLKAERQKNAKEAALEAERERIRRARRYGRRY